MKVTPDAAPPPAPGRTLFAADGTQGGASVGSAPARRDLTGQPWGVDARTAALRDRIAAASCFPLTRALLLHR